MVEMLNDHPISVNADRSAIAARCIKVTRANCKYGQAVDLARRQRDYFKTFGAENVRFRYYAVTQNYAAIEAEVGRQLMRHRMSGGTGRLNEWLQGISSEEVEQVVRAAVAAIPDIALTVVQARPSRPRVPGRSISFASVSPAQLVEAAEYLERQGMSLSLLRDIHHSPRRDETFRSTNRYFSEKSDLLEKNIAYGARLVYVAEQRHLTSQDFEALVQEALSRHPK